MTAPGGAAGPGRNRPSDPKGPRGPDGFDDVDDPHGSDALYPEEERARGRRGRRATGRGGKRRGRRRPDGEAGEAGEKGPVVEGRVASRSRRGCRVLLADGSVRRAYLGGRVQESEQPVVGDRVELRLAAGGEGRIETVLPRRNALSRVAEEDAGKIRTIAANIDRLVAVLAVAPFPPRWALADRLLALCEREGFEGLLVLNKCDLVAELAPEDGERLAAALEVYRGLAVPVLETSAATGSGIDALRGLLAGRVSVFSGHSGVGKSSLLNALHPGWELAVGEVNPQTRKGRQTTTGAILLELPSGGWVIDTPGFREFGLGQVEPAELGRYYPEFRPIIAGCRFSDCLHEGEPGCALREAVEAGAVSGLRYRNYLLILRGLLDIK